MNRHRGGDRRRGTGAAGEVLGLAGRDVTDADLLGRVAAGDGASFVQLTVSLDPMLRRVIVRLGLSETETEDSIQETLIRIWRAAAGFRCQSKVSTWACRIAINQGLATIRSRRPSPDPERVELANPERSFELHHQAELVRRAVTALPPPLRTVAVLRAYEDLSYRSIAEILDIPVGTVMSRLHAARKRLRADLGPMLD
jgi:RNA polymerase sigma-70 factor (ECF subfamily)